MVWDKGAHRVLVLCLLVLTVGWSAPAMAQGDDKGARLEAAQSMYNLAVEEFKAGNHKVALEKFLEVNKLDPNPVILYNIARCYEELDQLADAAEYFQKAAAHPDLPEGLLAEVGKRLPIVLPALQLREARRLAVNTIDIGVTQGGDRALAAYVASGQGKGGNTNITINNGDTTPNQGLLWGGGATALVGAGVLTAAFVVDLGLSDSIDEIQDPAVRAQRDRTLALQDQIESDQTTATVLYITGGVVLAAGATMLGLALMQSEQAEIKSEKSDAKDAGALNWAPFVGDGSAGIWVGGHFQ